MSKRQLLAEIRSRIELPEDEIISLFFSPSESQEWKTEFVFEILDQISNILGISKGKLRPEDDICYLTSDPFWKLGIDSDWDTVASALGDITQKQCRSLVPDSVFENVREIKNLDDLVMQLTGIVSKYR